MSHLTLSRSFWRRSLSQSIEKLNLTQQKQTCIEQHKIKKNKARFGRLLQPPAWKQNGLILKEVGQ